MCAQLQKYIIFTFFPGSTRPVRDFNRENHHHHRRRESRVGLEALVNVDVKDVLSFKEIQSQLFHPHSHPIT